MGAMKEERERHENVTRHTQPLTLGEKRTRGQNAPQMHRSAIAAAVRGEGGSISKSHKRASKRSGGRASGKPLPELEPLPVPVRRVIFRLSSEMRHLLGLRYIVDLQPGSPKWPYFLSFHLYLCPP